MVGCRAEVFTGMPEVDRLGREAFQKGPVVGGSIGDGSDGDIRACLADMGDLARKLCLQLAALRHAGEVESVEPFAVPVMEGDRAAGGLAPAGFVTPRRRAALP